MYALVFNAFTNNITYCVPFGALNRVFFPLNTRRRIVFNRRRPSRAIRFATRFVVGARVRVFIAVRPRRTAQWNATRCT